MPHRPTAGAVVKVFAAFLVLGAVSFYLSVGGKLDGAFAWRRQAPGLPATARTSSSIGRNHEFTLRHVFHHGTTRFPNLHRRLDVRSSDTVRISDDVSGQDGQILPAVRARSKPLPIQRLSDRSHESIQRIIDRPSHDGSSLPPSDPSDWTIDEIYGPDVTDKETVLSFARMAANAYTNDLSDADWQEVGGGFNYTEDFGWESDGIRGHIFADTENATVVIGMKGTSPAVFDGSDTTTNDKENDNLFFSCCCGQGGQYLWRKVCACQTKTYTCNSTCVVSALRAKNRYYYASIDLYQNVTALYPTADIWLAGHSLGGALSSLLGLTYGLPVLTFEAPGEALAATRLGLPAPPGIDGQPGQRRAMTGGFHFGHTADPLYMGTCNSASSFCTIAGYAMETVCHSGYECIYDTVTDFGWRVGIGTHRILEVIKSVLEKYDEPAKCQPNVDCVDCYNWKYFESNSSVPSTTSTSPPPPPPPSSLTTRTRTQTCKTPGWWGCLDESTTAPTSETTESSTSSSSTCKTPGWFGCKDSSATTTTTTTTTTKTVSTSSTTSTFVIPTAKPAPTLTSVPSSSSTASSTCAHHGWFGRCQDDLQTSSSRMTPTPTPILKGHPSLPELQEDL